MTALHITLIIIAVISLVIMMPVDCVIDLSYNSEKNRGNIVLKYALWRFTILPATPKEEKDIKDVEKDVEKEVKKEEKDLKNLLRLVKTVYEELRHDIIKLIKHLFQRTICIKELNISSKFGTGNPMYTGIVTGAVNSTVYNTVSWIDRHMELDKWNVSLDGDFDNACLDAGIYCVVRTRIAYVIKVGVMAGIVLLKIVKINRRIKKNGR